MSPDSPAKLIRLDLAGGTPSSATVIATGSLREMANLAMASATDDLWRFIVQTSGGGTLLPGEIARLHAAWADTVPTS